MKSDYLKECLTDLTSKVKKSIPIDQFNSEFCNYCINNECTRSSSSSTLFEKRVQNWQENLFGSVPRASDTDTTYDIIRAKWYKAIPSIGVTPDPTPPNTNMIVPQNKVIDTVAEKPKKPRPTKKRTRTEQGVISMSESPEKVSPAHSIGEEAPKPPIEAKEPPAQSPAQSPAQAPGPTGNTSWHTETFLPDSPNTEVVIKPGGSFTFGG